MFFLEVGVSFIYLFSLCIHIFFFFAIFWHPQPHYLTLALTPSNRGTAECYAECAQLLGEVVTLTLTNDNEMSQSAWPPLGRVGGWGLGFEGCGGDELLLSLLLLLLLMLLLLMMLLLMMMLLLLLLLFLLLLFLLLFFFITNSLFSFLCV
jgi:hypothetical protein